MTNNKVTYSLVLNSADKISGTNNSATFDINWDVFLSRKYTTYKMIFNFSTVGGYFKDGTYGASTALFSTAVIKSDFFTRAYQYESSTNSSTSTIGIIRRDPQTTTSTSNVLCCSYSENASKTINRPTQNVFTVSIYNNYLNSLLCTTNAAGNALVIDMPPWTMIIQFIPIEP